MKGQTLKKAKSMMYKTHQQATGVICKVNKNRQKSKFKGKKKEKIMMLKTHQHVGGVIYEEIYQQ